jgi:diacylglycerol kinase family enzyme
MIRTVLLVGNPSAQSGRAQEGIERAMAGLSARGARPTLLPTEPAGRTVDLVRDAVARERPDAVVAFGGDGTFNEVARGILAEASADRLATPHHEPATLGMLPMGTANDQGRSFGLEPGPEAIEKNLDVLLAGHAVQLDVGRVEALDASGATTADALFFDSAGWGMQPDILATRNQDRAVLSQIPLVRDIWRDQAVYVGAALDRFLTSFLEPTKFDAEIDSDAGRFSYVGLTDLILKNTAVYAGAWVLDRHGAPDDGKLDLIPMQGRRDFAGKALRDLASLPIWQEDLDLIGVTHSTGFSASRFDIVLHREGREDVRSQVDGEEWVAGRRFRVEVLANRLRLVVPAGFVPPWKT